MPVKPSARPPGVASRFVTLPPPETRGTVSVEEALAKRRSIRTLKSPPLDWGAIGQLLWAAQGITEPKEGLRTTPSAGALYPLELYVATPEGVFHYLPRTHQVERTLDRDVRGALRKAALDQECLDAPCVVAIAAVYERVTRKYPDIGRRSVDFEVGHCAQNVLLEVVALGLAAVPVAAFDAARVKAILDLPPDEAPLYLIPVGRAR
jgi:SagB-type dehydrogenase family enzyme